MLAKLEHGQPTCKLHNTIANSIAVVWKMSMVVLDSKCFRREHDARGDYLS